VTARVTARVAPAARAATPAAVEPIVYRVGMDDPDAHEFQIEMDVPALPDRSAVEIAFAAWAPGSYMIRDFVRHVYGLAITDRGGRPLAYERLDKQRWRVASGGAPFIVRYRVFAFEQTVRTSFLDGEHAYWNGTSLFFAVDGEVSRPCEVDVAAPAGWTISTALPRMPSTRTRARGRRGVTAFGHGGHAGGAPVATFRAAGYDELVDSPFEVGTHEVLRFRAAGAAFEVALFGRTNASKPRLVDILRRIVRTTAAIFGGLPFDRYVFIVHALPVATGGLEHHASVTMDIAGLSFEDDKGYVRFADLAAHEFFHVWNVKRLHDPLLGPFDYARECYTRLLWFHEGFTDYLANVIILWAGIIDDKAFWRWITEDWPRYAGRPGRKETPLAELSFEAWIKQYKPADNHFNRAVSYYEKGLWVAMALDLELRRATRGRRGLTDLFRWLWDRAGRRERAVTETDVRRAARAIGKRSFDGFFDRYVHGTEDPPLPALWGRAGLAVKQVAPWSVAAGETDDVRRARARSWVGIAVQGQAHAGGSERAVIKNVLPGSPAAAAGLTFGDEIVAIGGDRVNAATFARRLGDHAPGSRVTIGFFRRDRLREARMVVGTSPERKLLLDPADSASREEQAVRRGWLGLGRARARG
jgi:predicted metalloprotease with PDZ domain